jgi:hypothetical protein
MSEYERGCGDCAENGTDKRVSPCLECYSVAGRPNWRAAGSIGALRALAQENDRLRARIAELEGDAARYRVIRDAGLPVYVFAGHPPAKVVFHAGDALVFTGKTLDEAIDAARGQEANKDGA